MTQELLFEIHEITVAQLPLYAQVPMQFQSKKIWALKPDALGLCFDEKTLSAPFFKDYDQIDGGPLKWPTQFNLKTWGFFLATQAGRPVGGAALAFQSIELQMQPQQVILWDLRVHPAQKRQGLGQALFERALAWTQARKCSRLEIETQNNNPAACRFYQKMGCELVEVKRFAYPELPDEIQLVWYKQVDD